MTDSQPRLDADSNAVTLDAVSAETSPLSSPPTYGSRDDKLREVTEQSDQSADDIDVRKLFDNPTVNYLRWLYRQNGLAATVVDKPVADAFKHGFTLSSNEQNDSKLAEEWLKENYVEKQKAARAKARRDGLSFIYWIVNDTNTVHEEVENPQGIEGLKVLSLDDLADGIGNPRHTSRTAKEYATAQEAAEYTEYTSDQLVVTKSGVVVVDDITEGAAHESIVGIIYDRNPKLNDSDARSFIHADRLQHFVERENVDGDMFGEFYGAVEGDSVLTPIVHALTGLTKAEWALGQTLLRYTAPLHVVEIGTDVQPEGGSWEDHMDALNGDLDNLTNKSSLTLPPDHEAKTLGTDGEIDPEPFLEGLYKDVCAGSEITRSVLLGVQSGTVSGSSTDVKNYYNQVERNRDGKHAAKIHEAVEMASRFDPSAVPNFTKNFTIEWGPLFKIDDIDRTDGMVKVVSAASNAIGKYLLTPEEARDIIEEEWARLDVDVDFDELTETDMDQLDRINTQKGKQYPEGVSSEMEVEGETERSGQNGGGRSSQGREPNTTDPSDPTTQ